MIFIGYQAITFAVFTKIYAITHGLLPEDARLNRLLGVITLETGLFVGFVLILLGIVVSLFAVSFWHSRGFGPLDPVKTLRLVTPGVVFLAIGFQTLFSSFFLSVLGMAKR